jgi:hypothetical protein
MDKSEVVQHRGDDGVYVHKGAVNLGSLSLTEHIVNTCTNRLFQIYHQINNIFQEDNDSRKELLYIWQIYWVWYGKM